MRRLLLAVILLGSLCVPVIGFGETAEEMLSSCKGFANADVKGGGVYTRQDFESGKCWGLSA